jgi:dTDP-4-amino-4,6-dideoxygalactose transaminase
MSHAVTIPLARPALGAAEVAAVARVLASGQLTQGAETPAFEAALAAVTGRRHAVAVASGTAALDLALRALEVAPGQRVAVAGFGFPAAANLLQQRGAEVVLVDVDPASWTIDLVRLEAALASGVTLVVAIDQLGLATPAAAVEALARASGATVLGDAACGLGACDADGRPGGALGTLAILSFHPRKCITTGEGGAVLCDDARLAARLAALRNHGQQAPGQFVEPGVNARLGELGAALGRVQLERLAVLVAERGALAQRYQEALAGPVARGRLALQAVPPGARHAWQTFAVLLAADCARERVRAALLQRGIASGPATYAAHRLPWFAARVAPEALPVAEALHQRALALPLYPGLRPEEVDLVAQCLAEAVA